MTRPQSRFADPATYLFQDNQIPRVVSSGFWAYLVRHRPVFLVGGLWMLLICLAAGAYSRLMFIGLPPKPAAQLLITSPPDPFQAPQQNRGQFNNSSDRVPKPHFEFAAPETLGAVPEEPDEENFAPRWSLMLMVGFCALGCGVVSQQAHRSQKPLSKPRKPLKTHSTGQKSTLKLTLMKSKAPTRLPIYSSERDAALVPGRPAVVETEEIFQQTQGDDLAHVFSPKQAVQPTTLVSVSVVPEQETHPLDWPEGNLADTLDLRQRRSLSSFL